MGYLQEASVCLSDDVEVIIDGRLIVLKGNCGMLSYCLHDLLSCTIVNGVLVFKFCSRKKDISKSLLGTTCALIRSMLLGVTVGFTKKLQLIGVGYRASVVRNVVNLTVGFSHDINYRLPIGVSVDCPTSVDIIIHGMSKQLVGQVAADLRAIRPPEPFSGKGIRYFDEICRIKEVRKK